MQSKLRQLPTVRLYAEAESSTRGGQPLHGHSSAHTWCRTFASQRGDRHAEEDGDDGGLRTRREAGCLPEFQGQGAGGPASSERKEDSARRWLSCQEARAEQEDLFGAAAGQDAGGVSSTGLPRPHQPRESEIMKTPGTWNQSRNAKESELKR